MSEKNNVNLETEEAKPRGIVGLSLLTFILLLLATSMFALPYVGETTQGREILKEANEWLQVVGNLHPVILHLPIGIVVVTLFLEVLGWLSFGRWKPATNAILLIGVFSAFLANATGFLSMEFGGRVGESWTQHMWAGIIFAAIFTLAYIVKLWGGRNGSRNPGYAILLFIAVGVMSFGAHIGGEEVHGPVLAPLKARAKELAGLEEVDPNVVVKAPSERLAYEEIVVPILQAKCYDCHSEDSGKDKGGLLLDSIASMKKGGDTDFALEPGSLEKSYMIELIHLPADDEDRMPPPKKPRLEDYEIQLLDWWVLSGAPDKKTFTELEAPEEIIAAVAQMVSPEEREAIEKAEKAAAAKADAKRVAARARIEESLAELKSDAELKGAVNYLFQGSSALGFTAVSLRDKFTDEHAAKLIPVASNIESLNLAFTSITDAGLEKLVPAFEQLKTINLSGTGITDVALTSLSKVKSLEVINLHSTPVTNAGVAKLSTLPNLKQLYLWGSNANDEVEKVLKEKIPKIDIDFGVSAAQVEADAKKAAEEVAKADAEKKAAAEKAKAEAAMKAEADRKAAEAAAVEKAKADAAMKAEAEKKAADPEAAKKAAEELATKEAAKRAAEEAAEEAAITEAAKKALEEAAKQGEGEEPPE